MKIGEMVVEESNDPIDWASIWNREESKHQQMLEENSEIWERKLTKNGNNWIACYYVRVLALSFLFSPNFDLETKNFRSQKSLFYITQIVFPFAFLFNFFFLFHDMRLFNFFIKKFFFSVFKNWKKFLEKVI